MNKIYCFDCGSEIKNGELAHAVATIHGKVQNGKFQFIKKSISIHYYFCEQCYTIHKKEMY